MRVPQAFKFLKRYLFKHPLYVAVYAIADLSRGFTFNIDFLDPERVREAVRKGKSIIRLGDGEINLLLNLPNHYHPYSSDLKRALRTIIKTYSQKSPYILSVPQFVSVSNQELKRIGKLRVWLPFKVMVFLLFPKDIPYIDAHNFYYDGYFEEEIAPLFKDKLVVVVTQGETIEKQRSRLDSYWNEVCYVETPKHSALNSYKEIVSKVRQAIEGHPREKIILLVAFGPVGKKLLYELSQEGYQGIDVGKAIEMIFTGTSIAHLV